MNTGKITVRSYGTKPYELEKENKRLKRELRKLQKENDNLTESLTQLLDKLYISAMKTKQWRNFDV